MARFYSANPQLWSIIPFGIYNALELAFRCELVLEPETLDQLKSIPPGTHLIIVSNHADEMDIRVMMEFARRAQKRFRFMVNIEAFEEMRGFAGFWMTRVGCFSVERGASDAEAREQASRTIKSGKEALVMFPEGEIYYLNDHVQPFKTGAVRMGFEALQDLRRLNPGAAVYVLPVALKYSYSNSIRGALKQRLRHLEKKIDLKPHTQEIQTRLTLLMKHVVERYDMKTTSRNIASNWSKITEDISAWRTSVLSQLERKYAQIWGRPSQQLMDRAYRLIAKLRERMDNGAEMTSDRQWELRRDLGALKRTVWFASWAPQYHEKNPSSERLAECVMKLEREILGNPRPKPLGRRAVRIQTGELVDLGPLMGAYVKDSKDTCRKLTDDLQITIQKLIEKKAPEAQWHD
jgi:1-acyl-sn-glycerol-3-phosphate acyltransferase